MWTITNTVEYKFNIGDNHAITLLAGQEGIKADGHGFGTSGSGITDDRLANLGSVTDYNKPSYSRYKFLRPCRLCTDEQVLLQLHHS